METKGNLMLRGWFCVAQSSSLCLAGAAWLVLRGWRCVAGTAWLALRGIAWLVCWLAAAA